MGKLALVAVMTIGLAFSHSSHGQQLDKIVDMRKPTANEMKMLANSPAKEYATQDCVIGFADLDDDGVDEIVLFPHGSDYCGAKGDCQTVVLKRVGNGLKMFELNMYTVFGDTGQFGVLKQKKNGFRLLAEVMNGKIVMGDKLGTPLYRKPLIREIVVTQNRTK
jgi:hypothetical protein